VNTRKKVLAFIIGAWAGSMTVLVVKAGIDASFNLKTTKQILYYLQQEQYDGKFSPIINDLKEPPFDR